MARNPRPEEQLRGGNEPWERKFEGKSRLYEQEPHEARQVGEAAK